MCIFAIALCSLLSLSAYMYTPDTTTTIRPVLTADETACLDWFETTKTKINWGYKNLSQEDKAIFEQGIGYSDNQEAITRVMNNFVIGFYAHADKNNVAVAYDASMLSSILIKMQGYIAARMFVFSQLLTTEERLMFRKDAFTSSPEVTHAVVTKAGNMLANELARLNLIPNTDHAKKQAAQEFTDSKMVELERAYSK